MQLHSVCERCLFILPQGDRGDRGPRGLSGSPGPVGPAGAKVSLNAGLSVRVGNPTSETLNQVFTAADVKLCLKKTKTKYNNVLFCFEDQSK